MDSNGDGWIDYNELVLSIGPLVKDMPFRTVAQDQIMENNKALFQTRGPMIRTRTPVFTKRKDSSVPNPKAATPQPSVDRPKTADLFLMRPRTSGSLHDSMKEVRRG
mmetsp:Transcript_6028/g.9604  ORF Transcript_6028/g.9604 Transcript_6028/m.9604 type:complete len:107 (+) Transcript_6028:1097-1417(+)